jgi:hypothetical protein
LTCVTLAAPGAGRAGDITDFELLPTKLWIGVTNSDAVGTYLDVVVQAWDADGRPTGLGEARGVRAGGSGFRAARLVSVEMLRLLPGGDPVPGPPAVIQVDARISCHVRGHRNASIALWYNGLPVDTGRRADAGSRIAYAISDTPITLFLRPPDLLAGVPGKARLPVAMKLVGPRGGEVCADFKTFGTWAVSAEEP